MQRFRDAAHARRAAAEELGESRGDAAYRQYRSTPPVGARRRPAPTDGCQLRAEMSERNGKPAVRTYGYFTRYERGYPMWDKFGQYEEMTMKGSGTETLAANPDVAFLVNHLGVAMARTRARDRDATLILSEGPEGGYHEGWLNPGRQDVRDLLTAIDDGIITEMSFAFTIPDGKGLWSEDFEVFQILAYDIDRGDVSAVNYGANPFTDISADVADVMNRIEYLPAGAKEEAARRLNVDSIETRTVARERIEVSTRAVDEKASTMTRRLQWQISNTARRMAEVAAETGMGVDELANVRLPWYEIRTAGAAADPHGGGGGGGRPPATDILIYDEIGGSFGVDSTRFALDLAGVETPNINLRINSPGGSVFDALAIASSLRHKRDDGFRITSYVDGMAASAATIIALAADEVVAMPGAEFMIHNASMNVNGNKGEMATSQKFLDKQDRNIADLYAAKAGGDVAGWLTLMDEETWFLPGEAVDAGLIDRVWSSGNRKKGERVLDDPRLTRRWSGEQFRYRGRANAPVSQQRRVVASTTPTRSLNAESRAAAEADSAAFLQEVVDDYERKNGPAPAERMTVPDDPDQVTITNGSIGGAPAGRSIALITAQLGAEGADLD